MRRSLAVVVFTMAVAGCGNSGGKGMTRIEYAQRADAICAQYDKQTAKLGGRGSGVQHLATVADKTVPLLGRATARLRALPPPQAASALARRWLASLGRLREDVIEIRDAARANDLAAVRRVAIAAQRDNDTSNRLARQLGMQACSSS